MRRDQRGPWISSIRASIAKYTQCIEQTERAKQTPNGYAFEPEEAKLANEVKTRLQERMSELVPHQSALKLQMSHLTLSERDSGRKHAGQGNPTETQFMCNGERRSAHSVCTSVDKWHRDAE